MGSDHASAPDLPAVCTTGLSKSYGRHRALSNLDLSITPGQIFGFLGPNGAGKTTTIRLLAGLLRPSSGAAAVLGLDVVRHRDEVQARIGYLPGDFVGYPQLTAREYLDFFASLRPGTDRQHTHALAERLALPLDVRIGAMSHGNRQKVGIVQAMGHRPELLILDEPTTGLDPIVQREFLSMLRTVRNVGRTVFLSSHVLSEVEAVADTVGFVRDGALVAQSGIEELKGRALHTVELTLTGPAPVGRFERVPGVRRAESTAGGVRVWVEGSMAELFRCAAPLGVERVATHEADLEQIFLGYYEDGAA